MTELDLSGNGVSNLMPLGCLFNLNTLKLDGNSMENSDLNPLASLPDMLYPLRDGLCTVLLEVLEEISGLFRAQIAWQFAVLLI